MSAFQMPQILLAALRWMVTALVLGMCGLVPAQAQAESIAILLSDEGPLYQDLAQSLKAAIGARDPGHRWSISTLSADSSAVAVSRQKPDLIVALGVNALQAAARQPENIPTLVLMVPRNTFEAHLTRLVPLGKRAQFSALYLDQPLDRQLRAIRLALPYAKRVGVVTGPTTRFYLAELKRAAERLGLTIVTRHATEEDEVMPAMREVTDDSDVILLLHEPLLLQGGKLQTILLNGYRARVPVVAYSDSLVKAGALLAIQSDSDQIATEAAGAVQSFFDHGATRLSGSTYNKQFHVSTNPWVSRSLDLSVPEADWLSSNLSLMERK